MHLLNITDPRSSLDRTRRKDLQKYIEANGLDIDPWMPKDLMVKKLRAMGVSRIDAPLHQLGQPDNTPTANGAMAQDGPSVEVDATDALEAQWRAQAVQAVDAEYQALCDACDALEDFRAVKDLSMQELRKEVKRLGLKQKRTSKREELEEMIRGHATGRS